MSTTSKNPKHSSSLWNIDGGKIKYSWYGVNVLTHAKHRHDPLIEGMTSVFETSCPISLFSSVTHKVLLSPTPVQRKPIWCSTFGVRGRAGPERRGRRAHTPEDAEDRAEMYKLNPDCWVWSPRPPLRLHPQHTGRLTSAVLSHHEEEEEVEEEEEHPAVCCYTTGRLTQH